MNQENKASNAAAGWKSQAALVLTSLVSPLCFEAQAMWIKAFVSNKFFSHAAVGWLSAGELFLFGATNLGVASLWRYVNPRIAASCGTATVILGCMMVMVPIPWAVAMGILLCGIGAGSVGAALNGIAGRSEHSQHVFVLINAFPILLVSLMYFLAPKLIAHFGVPGLFSYIAIVGVVSFGSAVFGFPGKPPASEIPLRQKRKLALVPLVRSLGLAGVNLGATPILIYVAVIGSRIGLAPDSVGNAMAGGYLVQLLGLVIARLVGERCGLLKPLAGGLGAMALGIAFLLHAHSGFGFFISYAIVSLMATFYVPYALAAIGSADPTGQYVAAAAAFALFPAAVGAKIAGALVALPSLFGLGCFSLAAIAIAITIFVVTSAAALAKAAE